MFNTFKHCDLCRTETEHEFIEAVACFDRWVCRNQQQHNQILNKRAVVNATASTKTQPTGDQSC